jgi:hypothetical protein
MGGRGSPLPQARLKIVPAEREARFDEDREIAVVVAHAVGERQATDAIDLGEFTPVAGVNIAGGRRRPGAQEVRTPPATRSAWR